MLVLAEDSDEQRAAEEAYARLVEEGRIDGLADPERPSRQPAARSLRRRAPCRACSSIARHPGSGRNVTMRDGDAGRLAAEHLLELGHRALGHLAGPLELDTARPTRGWVRRRPPRRRASSRRASRRALTERGGLRRRCTTLVDPPVRARRRSSSPTSTRRSARWPAFASAGVGVPGDLSLVCHDDDPVCEYLDPPLTAIRMPLLRARRGSGRRAGGADRGRCSRSDIVDRDRARARVARVDRTARRAVKSRRCAPRRAGSAAGGRGDRARARLAATRFSCGSCLGDLPQRSVARCDGKWPAPLPMVLGHEGAGVIEAVGEGVDPRRGSASPSSSPSRRRVAAAASASRVASTSVSMLRGAWTPASSATARPASRVDGERGAPPRTRLVVRDARRRAGERRDLRCRPSLDPAHACLLGLRRADRVRVGDAAGRTSARESRSRSSPAAASGSRRSSGRALVSAHPIVAVDPLPEKRELALRSARRMSSTRERGSVAGSPRDRPRRRRPCVRGARRAGGRRAGVRARRGPGARRCSSASRRSGSTAAFPVYELTQFEHDLLGSHMGGATPALDIPALAALVRRRPARSRAARHAPLSPRRRSTKRWS